MKSADEVLAYFNKSILKEPHSPTTRLFDIMATQLQTCSPHDSLEELAARGAFAAVSGLPVLRADDGALVGVISKKDMKKPGTQVHVSLV